MHVISAALSYAASDVYFSFTAGDPYEDAEMELKEEMLDKAIRKYAPFIPEETQPEIPEPDNRPEVSES